MTDREAIELMAFFFAVAAACQVYLWLHPRKANTSGGSGSRQSR